MDLDEYQLAAARTVSGERQTVSPDVEITTPPTEADLQIARERSLALMALGVSGEAGEIVDLALQSGIAQMAILLRAAVGAGEIADDIKKVVGHGHTIDRVKLGAEIGDQLWYLAALCTLNGLSLGQVADDNLTKLKQRYPDGFDPLRSQQRAENDRTVVQTTRTNQSAPSRAANRGKS